MGLILDRTVSRVSEKGETGSPEPLAAYRDTPAYVLLADPGAGKTTLLQKEAADSGDGAAFLSAWDFLDLHLDSRPEWRSRTLLIDGLDEVRAGERNARTPLGMIRGRLDQLRPPGFRISCREADWLGDGDRALLESVSPDAEVVVLRLNPLGNDDIRALVSSLMGPGDPDTFLLEAADRGLESLLDNPQSLELLVKAFQTTGQWPASRLETFEKAALALAREEHEGHRVAAPLPPPREILDVAGRLAAVQLLSAKAGYSLAAEPEDSRFIAVSNDGGAFPKTTQAALSTKLFRAAGIRRFEPSHAHMGAFLAARHLAMLGQEHLPGGRILALLAGHDQSPPTHLRGLAAWLAATSPALRAQLIARDPVAVLMYGDIAKFKPCAKQRILEQLRRDPSRLHEMRWSASAITGLATPEMTPALTEFLDATERDENSQGVAEVITKALRHSASVRGVSHSLLRVATDDSWWFRVRRPALDAWIHSLSEEPSRDARLRDMLDGIRDGQIEDHGGELLGTLLRELYPRALGPSELWDYFNVPSEPLMGRFFMFWQELPTSCPEEHLPAHLDHLSRAGQPERPETDLPRPTGLPVRFLARGLRESGTDSETSHLIRWLRIGLTQWGELSSQDSEGAAACDEVRQWLESRPEVQKRVIRAALRTAEFRNHHPEHIAHYLSQLLYGSSLPVDIGDWHLDEASRAKESRLTEIHVRLFLIALAERPARADTRLSGARRKLASHPGALDALEASLQSHLPEGYLERRIRRQTAQASWAKPDEQLIGEMRRQWSRLLGNRGSLALLRYIAQKRYEDGGRAALQEALAGNKERIEVAVASIRSAPDRSDLPSAEDIVRLLRQKGESPFVWPVLVGLSERQPADVLALDDWRLRTILALRLVYLGLAQQASWYRRCVEERADLVSDVLLLVGRALLQKGETFLPDLHSLVHDATHQEVARRATLPLLRAFPVRAKAEQLRLLNELLWSALRHSDSAALRATIERKLTSRSMTLNQRTLWLAAGLASDPSSFLPRIEQQIAGSTQVARLAEFFSPSYPVAWLREKLDVAAVAFLIRTIGQMFEPTQEEGLITIRTEASDCVRALIAGLGACPDSNAAAELNSLATNPRLAKWRWLIAQAKKTQRVVQRDAAYRPPTPTQVLEALRDGPPVSPLDLRELVADRLDRIKNRMRTTPENLWRQYWNENSYRRPIKPKPEGSGRDSLLVTLQSELPEGCEVRKEVSTAGDGQSDLTVTCGDLHLPFEIKKAEHRDLWRAASEQLLAKYATDPDTGGLGVYVVLWFGPKLVRTSPTGRKPTDPDELCRWLEEALEAPDRPRVAVVVLDVTPPPNSLEKGRRGPTPVP